MLNFKLLFLPFVVIVTCTIFSTISVFANEVALITTGLVHKSGEDYMLVEPNGNVIKLYPACNAKSWFNQMKWGVIESSLNASIEFGKSVKILGSKSESSKASCIADVQIVY